MRRSDRRAGANHRPRPGHARRVDEHPGHLGVPQGTAGRGCPSGRVRADPRRHPPLRHHDASRTLPPRPRHAGGARQCEPVGRLGPRLQRSLLEQTAGPDRRTIRLQPRLLGRPLGRAGPARLGHRADRSHPRAWRRELGRQRRQRHRQHHHAIGRRDSGHGRRGVARIVRSRSRQRALRRLGRQRGVSRVCAVDGRPRLEPCWSTGERSVVVADRRRTAGLDARQRRSHGADQVPGRHGAAALGRASERAAGSTGLHQRTVGSRRGHAAGALDAAARRFVGVHGPGLPRQLVSRLAALESRTHDRRRSAGTKPDCIRRMPS